MAMPTLTIDSFLKKIMSIEVLRLGGVSPGVFGISGADNDTLNKLKKSTINYAKEYSRPNPNNNVLTQHSQEIEGYLQVLQLTNTISKETVELLINELQELTAKPSA